MTGASRGIGHAVAEGLAEAGVSVIGLSRTGTSASRGVRMVACDLTDQTAVGRAVELVTRELGGAPDILVNNAGAFVSAPVEMTPLASFTELVALNLAAPFQLTRAFVPGMRARGRGHVLTIGSIADHRAFAGNGAYAATKYGLRGLHEVLRVEVASSGVRATLISPAAVDTPLWERLDPTQRASFPARDDMLVPTDVADAVPYAVTRPAGVSIDEIRLSKS